jgi:hypothetical protein
MDSRPGTDDGSGDDRHHESPEHCPTPALTSE